MPTLALLLLLQVGLPPMGAGGGRALRPPPPPPPVHPSNVLVIVIDDIGADQIGCYAQNYAELDVLPCTPNIDALAEGGMRFTNAWANPVCSPTRAALHTGRPARRTGIGMITGDPNLPAFNFGLQLDQPSLPKLLQGYTSVALGKWHLSDHLFEANDVQHPIELGYQYFAGSLYNLDIAYNDWTKTVFPDDLTLPNYIAYATTDTTEDALGQLGTLAEPWFLYVSYNSAHDPTHCPADLGFVPGPAPGCAMDWTSNCTQLLGLPPYNGMFPEVVESRAMAQAMDSEIGRLLASVDLGDTAVVLVSDNGSGLRAVAPPFPPQHAKGTVYQGGINVPLIVRAPGGLSGVCHELVNVADLYATVADLTDISLPPDPQRDSVSLTQYVDPAHVLSAPSPREHVYSESFGPNFMPDPNGDPPAGYFAHWHHRAIRNATHKLIDLRNWDSITGECSTEVEFYALADAPPQDPALGPDPHEQSDLLLEPGSWSPETTASFEALVELLELQHPALPVGTCP